MQSPVMPATQCKVLEQILAMADERRPITCRALCARLGWKSTGWITICLAALLERGLIRKEPGRVAAIFPTCRLIPVHALAEADDARDPQKPVA